MYPQKMPCTPKIQPLGVHVPSNKFVSGHAGHGSTHAELEIKKTAFVIPAVQNIFGFIIEMQQI